MNPNPIYDLTKLKTIYLKHTQSRGFNIIDKYEDLFFSIEYLRPDPREYESVYDQDCPNIESRITITLGEYKIERTIYIDNDLIFNFYDGDLCYTRKWDFDCKQLDTTYRLNLEADTINPYQIIDEKKSDIERGQKNVESFLKNKFSFFEKIPVVASVLDAVTLENVEETLSHHGFTFN